jgi:tetratricopeptide (TPR) repeat protein
VTANNSDSSERILELDRIQEITVTVGSGEGVREPTQDRHFSKESSMKRYLTIVATLAFLVGIVAPFATAATGSASASVWQDPKEKEEQDLYKAWYEAKKAGDNTKVIEIAKEFVEKFPNSKMITYVKPSIQTSRTVLLTKATTDKNVSEIINQAKLAISENPDKELDYDSFIVAQIATLELYAQPPNFSHAREATEYAQKSISLIDAGKTPSTPDFKKNVALAYLYNVQAVIAKNDKNTDKALEMYQKAASYEPANPQYYLQCGSLHQQKYAAAANEYQQFPEDKRVVEPDKMEPAVKASLDKVNGEADAVIKCWAKFVGLTRDKKEWDGTRAQVEKVLTDLYKFRHNDSTDGLEQLIESFRSGSGPASNGTTASQQ